MHRYIEVFYFDKNANQVVSDQFTGEYDCGIKDGILSVYKSDGSDDAAYKDWLRSTSQQIAMPDEDDE